MVPSRTIRNAAMALLAADTATFAPAADAIYMVLFQSEFIPSESLLLADLEKADFAGYADIAIELNAQQVGYQPGTDDSVMDVLPPVGGFRWESTADIDPAQTIYGWGILNHAKTVLMASEIFDTPIVLTLAHQRVELPDAKITLPKDSIY
jgi:hypothetical protein